MTDSKVKIVFSYDDLTYIADFLESDSPASSRSGPCSWNRFKIDHIATAFRHMADGEEKEYALNLFELDNYFSVGLRDLAVATEYYEFRNKGWKSAAVEQHLQDEWGLGAETVRAIRRKNKQFGKEQALVNEKMKAINPAAIDFIMAAREREKEKSRSRRKRGKNTP